MIVPSITVGLALLNLVSAVAPAHVRRQTVNATPAQALAASVQANAVISEIIIVIVKQAAAAAAAISSASVARTATTAVTSSSATPVSSSTSVFSTSSTSASASTPSPSCYDTRANSLQIPTILQTPNVLIGTPCYSACQNAILSSVVCTATASTSGSATVQCSCAGGFLQSLAQCAVCQDSINGINVGFYIQRFQSQCNVCVAAGFADSGSSNCPVVPSLPNCSTTSTSAPVVVSSTTTTTTTTTRSTTSTTSTTSSTSVKSSTSTTSSTSSSSTTSTSKSSSPSGSALPTYTPSGSPVPTKVISSSYYPSGSSSGAPAPTCVAPSIVKVDTNPLTNIVNAVGTAPPCASICGIMNTAISNCAVFTKTADQAACTCSTQFINQAEACSVCLDSYLGRSTLNYGNATSLCLNCGNAGLQPTGLSVCGSNSDLSFCGLYPVQDPVYCRSTTGSNYNGQPCTTCSAGTYSTSNTCQSCTNGTQFSNAGATSCLPCVDPVYSPGVLTCKVDSGKATSCQPGYGITYDYANNPYCQIICPAGSGSVNINNTPTCVPCKAGYYNDKLNSCTQCGDFTWTPGNTTLCTPCIYDKTTMEFASCDSTNGNPTYCKYGLAGLTKTALPSPKACVVCLYGYSVAGFSNDCQCQSGYTNVTTTPCLNGTAPVSFDTARIYVTENNNGCKRPLGWLSQTVTNGYSIDGSFFGFSLDATKALQVRMPLDIKGGVTEIQAVTPFAHGYSYLGIQMGNGQLGTPFSSYPLKRMNGILSGSQFVNPGSYFGEYALANGFLQFGSIGENATADCWVVNPYDTCRNGYPLTLSLRIPPTLGLGAFVSNNASFQNNGVVGVTPIDNIDFSLLNGNGNNGEIQLTLVPN